MNKKLSDFLSFKPVVHDKNADLRHKFAFLSNIIAFAIALAVGMGIFHWENSPLLTTIDFVYTFMGIILLYLLRRRKDKFNLISNLAFILSFIFIYSIYLLAPYNATRVLLFFLLISAIYFIKGRVIGFYWTIFFLCAIALAGYIPNIDINYSSFDVLTTCTYLIAYYFIFDTYEAFQEKRKNNLEKKLLQQTKELTKTKETLDAEKHISKTQTSIDQLTGLNSRYKLRNLFEFEKLQVARYQTHMCVILINVNYFRSINDTFGHTVGDSVLIEIASILNSIVRRSDIIIRWSGDEFVILATKTNTEQAIQISEKVAGKIEKHRFKSIPGTVTISFGVSSFYTEDTFESMVQRADNELQLAKKNRGKEV